MEFLNWKKKFHKFVKKNSITYYTWYNNDLEKMDAFFHITSLLILPRKKKKKKERNFSTQDFLTNRYETRTSRSRTYVKKHERIDFIFACI